LDIAAADLVTIGLLVVLEGLLSADNALAGTEAVRASTWVAWSGWQ